MLGQGLSALTRAGLGVRAAVTTPGVLAAVLTVSGLVGLLAALPVAWTVSRVRVSEALRSG